MNKPEYSFSKRVKVPDGWIEKALAIPYDHSEDTRASSFNVRRLTAAAAVVLVIGIGIYLYFLSRNINSPAVSPSTETIVSLPATEPHTAASQPTVTHGSAASQAPTAAATADVTAPSEPATSGHTDSTASPKPTAAATAAPTYAPTVAPTQKPSVHSRPTSIPSTEPEKPTEDDPPEPAIPTEWIDSDPQDEYVEIAVPLSELNLYELLVPASGEPNYYCKLYDSGGRLIGHPDLYSEAHRAVINGNCLYYCDSVGSYRGTYTYVFYDRSGNVLYSGSAYT